MTDGDEITQVAPDDLVEALNRLEASGVHLVELVDRDGVPCLLQLRDDSDRVLVQCAMRLAPLDQMRELVMFYDGLSGPGQTRH